tara:strand:- start:658 stop:1551 length:894 start_codon:yes stop_codon:yes gene_type:complete
MNLAQTTKNTIDWTKVLLSANIDVPMHRNEFSLVCPFHLDTTPSCSINLDKGVWICFAGCGQGSLRNFVQRVLDIDNVELEKLLGEVEYTLDLDLFEEYQPTDNFLAEITLPEDIIVGKYPTWVYRRGFTTEVLDEWECGTNLYDDLVIPIRDEKSRLVGWVTRRRAATPKYMYSKGLKKSKVLFGAHKITPCSFVCITEGTLDTMWMTQHGYPAIALLGMSMSKRQQELLSTLRTEEVVLCLDNDTAGQTGLNKALQALGNTIMSSYVQLPDGYKDVQEIKIKKVLDTIINKRYYW